MTIASFIFDPLCGWCYGAAPVLERMGEDGFGIELLPLGQMAEACRIEGEFADLIWATDRLVAQHTGQPFTLSYRSLLKEGTAMRDASPATRAIIAVARTRPDRQVAALQALQIARFVNGRDTGDPTMVETILREIGLHHAADLCATANPVLVAATAAAVGRARALLAEYGTDDGPAVLLTSHDSPRLLGAKVLIARAAAQKPRAESAAGEPTRPRLSLAIPRFA